MNRQQLAHLLRAACQIADDPDVLVLGSQTVLGTWDEDFLPPEATASMEADLAFLDDPDREKADAVESGIGELSSFHASYGFYAEGIHVSTAMLPNGWRDRLRTWDLQSSLPARPWFLEPHDLAIAKLCRSEEKDTRFVSALIRNGLVQVPVLRERVELLEPEPRKGLRAFIHGWLDPFDGGRGRPSSV